MLLTGTFARTVDDKQRIAIPKQMRAALAQSDAGVLYVAPGTDGSLTLYSEQAFARLARRLATAPSARGEVRAFGRLFYAQARRVELDSQGRIRIAPELVEWAQLKQEAVLVGVGDHMELWDAASWQAYVSGNRSSYDRLAEAALDRTKHPK